MDPLAPKLNIKIFLGYITQKNKYVYMMKNSTCLMILLKNEFEKKRRKKKNIKTFVFKGFKMNFEEYRKFTGIIFHLYLT